MSCASSLNVFGTSRSRPNACSTRLRVSLNRSASSRYLARSAGNPRSMPSALPLQSAIWLERSLIRPLRPSRSLPSASSRLPSLRAFQSVLTPSERLGVAASISSTSCRRHSFRLSSSLISPSAPQPLGCCASRGFPLLARPSGGAESSVDPSTRTERTSFVLRLRLRRRSLLAARPSACADTRAPSVVNASRAC